MSGPLFNRLGVRPVINAVGPATRLGGLTPDDEVIEAMGASLRVPVRMDELLTRSGAHLARLLGVPAAYITSGASAALSLATAIAIARGDAGIADSLPRSSYPSGVLIQDSHRDPYDRAVEVAGGQLRIVGYPEGTHRGEVERALTNDVVAVLYRPGRPGNSLPLAEVAAVARERGVLVIVDGALHVPPVARLQTFLDQGADLVAVSGGKGFGGPQASGLLCGRTELVELAGRFHQDMDERESTWPRPTGDHVPPRHGIARQAKVGREQVAGLVVAIERFLEGQDSRLRAGLGELSITERELVAAGWHVSRIHLDSLDVEILEVNVGPQLDRLSRRLAARDTPVYVGESEAWRGVITLNPMALLDGQGSALAEALLEESE